MTESIESRRDRNIYPGACCANCAFAFPVKVTLKDTALDCRACPPQFAVVPLLDSRQEIIGAKATPIPRIVREEYFCGAWQANAKSLA